MSLSVSTSIQEVGGKLKLTLKTNKNDLKDAMDAAGWRFVDYIVENQMSGPPGVNSRSGRLANSWRVRTRGSKANLVTTITNYTPYVEYLQDGTKTMRKRLKITERFETIGKRLFRSEIREVVD